MHIALVAALAAGVSVPFLTMGIRLWSKRIKTFSQFDDAMTEAVAEGIAAAILTFIAALIIVAIV